MEATGNANTCVVALKDLKNVLDSVANAVIIGDQIFPRDFRADAQRCACEAGDDSWLAFQIFAGRSIHACGRVHHRHRVFDCDRLWTGRLYVKFRSSETGHDQSLLAVYEVASVELGRDLNR